jgi:hypothetical protein
MMAKQLKPSLNRHRAHCSVCAHERCADIESDFIEWKNPAVIAVDYGLADRMNVYRHAIRTATRAHSHDGGALRLARAVGPRYV